MARTFTADEALRIYRKSLALIGHKLNSSIQISFVHIFPNDENLRKVQSLYSKRKALPEAVAKKFGTGSNLWVMVGGYKDLKTGIPVYEHIENFLSSYELAQVLS